MYIETNTIPLGQGQQITVSGGGSVTPTFGNVTQLGANITSYDIYFPSATPGGSSGALQWNNAGSFDGFWLYDPSINDVSSTGVMSFTSTDNFNITQSSTGSGIGMDTTGFIGIGANGGGVHIAENTNNNYLYIDNDGSVSLRATANKMLVENIGYVVAGNSSSLSIDDSGNIVLQALGTNLQIYNYTGSSNGLNFKSDGSVTITSTLAHNLNLNSSGDMDLNSTAGVNITSNGNDMVLTSNGNSMHLWADHELTIKGGVDGEDVYMEHETHGNQFSLKSTGSNEINTFNNGHVYVNLDGTGAMFVKGRLSAKVQTQTMTTGGSVTSNGSPTLMLHTATGSAISTYTVNFPTFPVDGQYFCITTDTPVTTLGLTVSGTGFTGTPSTITTTTPANFQWSQTLNKWLRV